MQAALEVDKTAEELAAANSAAFAAARKAYNSEATAMAARKVKSRDMRKSTDGAPARVTLLCIGCDHSLTYGHEALILARHGPSWGRKNRNRNQASKNHHACAILSLPVALEVPRFLPRLRRRVARR
jgi:hypothetical protein